MSSQETNVQPEPDPKPKLEATTDLPLTAIAVINPSILLMGAKESIKVLLSRDTQIDPTTIYLQGVRLIEIPLGWKLTLLRIASRFWKVRLPDEFEFAALRIMLEKSPSPAFSGRIKIG